MSEIPVSRLVASGLKKTNPFITDTKCTENLSKSKICPNWDQSNPFLDKLFHPGLKMSKTRG